MSYSKTLSAEKMQALSPVIAKLSTLKPGDEIYVSEKSSYSLDQFRLWFYNWIARLSGNSKRSISDRSF